LFELIEKTRLATNVFDFLVFSSYDLKGQKAIIMARIITNKSTSP